MHDVSRSLGSQQILRHLDFEVGLGEFFVIIGASGCGKSTTLRLINRLIEPTGGRVEVMGRDVSTMDVTSLRRGIGYVIQETGLFAHWTVRQNVSVVPRLLGWPKARIAERVEELLEIVGLPMAEYGERFPRELSGGQRQRVGIARALAADPPIVLFDEPFGALDPVTREHLEIEIRNLQRRLNKTMVWVTHNMFEAVRLADRIGVMHEGEFIRIQSPYALMNEEHGPFVHSLLGPHRFQLRLMTMTLAHLSEAAKLDKPEGSQGIVFDETTNLWDALSISDDKGADSIGIRHGDAVRWLRPRDLWSHIPGLYAA